MGEVKNKKGAAKSNKQTTKQADGANSHSLLRGAVEVSNCLVTATLRAHFNW